MNNVFKSKFFWPAAGIAIALGLVAGFIWFQPHTFHGTVIQSPEHAPDFNFTASGDKQVSLADYRGKLVLLYFGYTFCPDICPATLGNVAHALRSMDSKKAAQVQLIMISVDPERDTPEKLAAYVSHFYPTFIGVTGEQTQLAVTASLYGIFYQKHPGTDPKNYQIDHTATLLVIDKNGFLKLVLPFGVTADEIADDLKYMLR